MEVLKSALFLVLAQVPSRRGVTVRLRVLPPEVLVQQEAVPVALVHAADTIEVQRIHGSFELEIARLHGFPVTFDSAAPLPRISRVPERLDAGRLDDRLVRPAARFIR